MTNIRYRRSYCLCMTSKSITSITAKGDAYKPNCDFNGVCIDLITLNCGIETEFLV